MHCAVGAEAVHRFRSSGSVQPSLRHSVEMNPLIATVIASGGGVAVRSDILKLVSHDHLDRAISRGELVRILPRVITWAGREDSAEIRARAALAFAGPDALLSHVTAAERWGMNLPDAAGDHVHVGIPRPRQNRTTGYVVVHRLAEPHAAVVPMLRRGLPVTDPVQSLLGSWAILATTERRDVVIDAVRQRIVSATAIITATSDWSQLRGRRELRELASDLAAGAHSELEIFGLHKVFEHPSLPRPRRQFAVVAGGRRYLLDLAYPDLKLGVELDGAAHHSGRADRERDLRRDARLAVEGWHIVRITYRRLTTDPDGVRRELVQIIATRRALLSA